MYRVSFVYSVLCVYTTKNPVVQIKYLGPYWDNFKGSLKDILKVILCWIFNDRKLKGKFDPS